MFATQQILPSLYFPQYARQTQAGACVANIVIQSLWPLPDHPTNMIPASLYCELSDVQCCSSDIMEVDAISAACASCMTRRVIRRPELQVVTAVVMACLAFDCPVASASQHWRCLWAHMQSCRCLAGLIGMRISLGPALQQLNRRAPANLH